MAETTGKAVFLSYAHEDAMAAERIAEALCASGVEVWFDQSQLVGGDVWDQKIRRQINACALFLPIISANSQARKEGYFRLEWKLAEDRSHLMAKGIPFIVPVSVDGTTEHGALVPDAFTAVQWTRLQAGQTSVAFVQRVQGLLGVTSHTKLTAPSPSTAPTPGSVLATSADDKSIAVLPFANMSADAENEYFSDGMTEEIINALVQVPGLHVAARTSVFAFKGKADDLRTIAAKLNVRTVLEGSVRKAGNRIRITAQLINAADGYHLWSERFDRAIDDIFAVQDEIARTIVEKLKVKLVDDGQQPLVTPSTKNLEAYELYLQGRYFWGQRGAGLAKGLQCFEAALARDPNYALAHAGVADAYTLLAFYGYSRPNEVMPKARAAAERALAIDPNLAEAQNALGFILLSYDWNIPTARRELQRAITLKPTYVPARYWFACVLSALGQPDDAVAMDEEAVRIEPLSLFANAHLGWLLLAAGRTEEARRRLEHTLELHPRLVIAHWLLGQAYLSLGRNDEGLAELRTAVEVSSNLPWMVATLGCALAHVGQPDEARAVLADLVRRSEREYVRAYLFAMLHAHLGEEDQMLHWLEKAREESDLFIPYFESGVNSLIGQGIPREFLSGPKRDAIVERLGIIRA